MRIAGSLFVSLLFVLPPAVAASAPAAPDGDPDAEPPPPKAATVPAGRPHASARQLPRLERPSLVHDMQFGVAVMPGTGYRGIFPYQDDIYCGRLGKRVCTGRMPFFLDTQISFGFARSWDLLVDLRFGIEQDFTQTHQFAVAPGFRYWADPDLNVKLYATLQLAIDTTNQRDASIDNNDFGVRNANGLMYEVMRNFGIYLQLGETIGFVRWLRFEIDGGVGVQARFP